MIPRKWEENVISTSDQKLLLRSISQCNRKKQTAVLKILHALILYQIYSSIHSHTLESYDYLWLLIITSGVASP